ncbi:MAG: hypothetical protein WAM06_01775 [Methyloceanibacter sp.]
MMRFKATGYTEYCPVYEPPLPPKEPDYSRFKFRSRLKPRPAKPDACECQVAALEAIRQLLTAPLISSPLVSSEATFEAPYPCMSEPRDRLPETIRITQEQYELAKVRWNSHHEQFKVDKKTEDWIFGKLREAWNAQRPEAIRCIVAIALNNANVPWPATYGHRVYFDNSNRLLLVEYNLPDIHKLSFNWSLGSGTQAQLNLKEQLLYSWAMRLLFDLATLVEEAHVMDIALTGRVALADGTDREERKRNILSVVANRRALLSLRIDRINPKEAFHAFKGRMTANLSAYSPVAPLVVARQTSGRR